jgi:signal transduction histidine kinase
MRTKPNRYLFSPLSFQQRLAVLICSLLLVAVTIFSFVNYYSLKKANLIIAGGKLDSLTDRLNSFFGNTAQSIVTTSNMMVAQKAAVQYLKSRGINFRKETRDELDKLNRDSTSVFVELVNRDLLPLMRSDKSTVDLKLNLKDVFPFAKVAPDSTKIGRLINVNGHTYYPVISAVSDKNNNIGYIIAWKSIITTSKSVGELLQSPIIGAEYFIGNVDGSLCTDFVKAYPNPPFKIGHFRQVIEYDDPHKGKMMAEVRLMPHTDFLFAVAFSEHVVLGGLTNYVKRTILIGLAFIAIGVFATWMMGRTITKPLHLFIEAASKISRGDYSSVVPIDLHQNDDMGKLANAFNYMVSQAYQMRNELENKVEERTSQLETANKELEAFSYSISHDLRTPLRAIYGYADMLNEDYGAELDAEGRRIIGNIVTNAKIMGKLIDDLLAFSRLGKKEMIRSQVDMQSLTEGIANALLKREPENKYRMHIILLPPAKSDPVMLTEVITNLLSNAIKYSSKKAEPQIEIGSTESGTETIYYVKDNGAGFDMAYAHKLFGVFQRLHSQQEFEGTGMGLALVKRIIEKLKGKIWAEGIENQGATFYFSLPKS